MASQGMQSEPPPWRGHEDHVGSLYRLLGFTVIPNINIEGKQTDLLCEKWIAGVGRTRLYIDCKYTRLKENKSVSKDDVENFIYTVNNRLQSAGLTAGVMVSNRPFSQYARSAAAGHPNVHLKTIDELHEEVLQIHAYLHDSIQRYEQARRFFDFVPPYGSESDTPEFVSRGSRQLQELIARWLQDNSQQLCLFGDFGTGKTTFLEFLHYTFAKKYLADGSVRIPLMIPLRRYYEATDCEEIIKLFFSQECGVNVQYSLFREFLTKGRFLLLLDGFDEMGAKSDPTIRKSNYLKLASFAEGASKILISCRPAYFLSVNETHSVFSFVNKQIGFAPPANQGPISEYLYHVVQDADLTSVFQQTRSALTKTLYAHINLFDNRQIKTYLKRHKSDIENMSGGKLDPSSLFKKIKEVYDLEDLARRPILLKLIVETLPLFKKTAEGKYEIKMGDETQTVFDITPSILYTAYTEKELEREYLKGKIRWLIDRQVKVRIIAAIAFEMFRRDTVALDKGTISRVVQTTFPDDEDQQAYYLTDIRTCSFLNRDFQDSVRFTHKSFMEYYAAVYLRSAMSRLNKIQELLSIRPLSDEVAFFLGDSIATASGSDVLSTSLSRFFQRLAAVESPPEACIQNLLNILNYARLPISPLKGIKINLLLFRKLNLEQYVADEVSLGTLRTIRLRLSKWEITNSEIRCWEADQTQIRQLIGKTVDLRVVRFWNTSIQELYVSNSSFLIETWRESHLKTAIFRDTIIVNIGGSIGPQWLPSKGVFENCVLVGLDLIRLSDCDCTFSGCTMITCLADETPKKTLKIESCRGLLITPSREGLRQWGYGIHCCGYEAAKKMHRSEMGKSADFERFLLDSFGAEIERVPRSAAEVKARLRDIEIATRLSQHLKKIAIVKAGDFATGSQCQIVRVDSRRVVLHDLGLNTDFEQPLRKISLEGDTEIQIRVQTTV
jgi:hypothetical protein